MENELLQYKMYGLVIRNIGEIDKGLQFSHALQEYNNGITALYDQVEYDNCINFNELLKNKYFPNNFFQWASGDKTVILLNGGTSSDYDINNLGTINKHFIDLQDNKIPFSYFREPDLNNALTAICFLVDERVYDRKKYPEFNQEKILRELEQNNFFKFILKSNEFKKLVDEKYNEWVEYIGGESNVFLREFLKDKRLA
jgi:hypothetical protein